MAPPRTSVYAVVGIGYVSGECRDTVLTLGLNYRTCPADMDETCMPMLRICNKGLVYPCIAPIFQAQ